MKSYLQIHMFRHRLQTKTWKQYVHEHTGRHACSAIVSSGVQYISWLHVAPPTNSSFFPPISTATGSIMPLVEMGRGRKSGPRKQPRAFERLLGTMMYIKHGMNLLKVHDTSQYVIVAL